MDRDEETVSQTERGERCCGGGSESRSMLAIPGFVRMKEGEGASVWGRSDTHYDLGEKRKRMPGAGKNIYVWLDPPRRLTAQKFFASSLSHARKFSAGPSLKNFHRGHRRKTAASRTRIGDWRAVFGEIAISMIGFCHGTIERFEDTRRQMIVDSQNVEHCSPEATTRSSTWKGRQYAAFELSEPIEPSTSAAVGIAINGEEGSSSHSWLRWPTRRKKRRICLEVLVSPSNTLGDERGPRVGNSASEHKISASCVPLSLRRL